MTIALEQMKIFSSKVAVREMGFTDDALTPDDTDWLEERALARSLLLFVSHQVATEINDGREHSDSLPGLFGALNVAEYQHAALEKRRHIGDCVVKLEDLMQEDPNLRDYWTALMFPGQAWTREHLIALYENDFALPLQDQQTQELRQVGLCMKGSSLIENLFNDARAAERSHRATKLGRAARWHRSHVCGLAEDWDRPRPEVRPEHKMEVEKTLPESDFLANQSSFSLGREKLDMYQGEKTWASPKPENLHKIPQMLTNLIHLIHDRPHFHRDTYVCLLFDTECLVKFAWNGVQVGALVLSVSEHALIVWIVDQITPDGHDPILFVPHLDDDNDPPWTQLLPSVEELTDWRVSPTELLTPSLLNAAGAAPLGLATALTVQRDTQLWEMHPIEFGAHRAFYKMGVDVLEKFIVNILKKALPRPKPKTEYDWAKLAMKLALPEIDDNECHELIMTWRVNKKKANPPRTHESHIDAGATNALVGVLDDDDLRNVRARQHRRAQAAEVEQQVNRAVAKKRSGPRAPRRMEVINWDHYVYTSQEAAFFMPKVVGATISKDTVRQMRWTASYPAEEPPWTHSATWNQERSDTQALRECLQWAWRHWERMHPGESCPFGADWLGGL